MTKTPIADKSALAKVGKAVRTRLAADPGVHKVPIDEAEIYAVGDFLTLAERQELMAIIDRVARPSTLYDQDHTPDSRTSYSGDVERHDPFVQMIERRICDLLGIDPAWAETMQGQRYYAGQQFKGHYDWFNTAAPYWPSEVKRGGQRSWTAMVYLNEVEEGGETEFTQLDFCVPPQAGMLLAWNNALPDGRPNPATLHAAIPVARGTKYVITKWFRTRPWS